MGHRRRGICTHQLACQILQRQQAAASVETVRQADAERLARFAALFDADDDTCSVAGCDGWATISGGTCREHSRSTVAA